MFKDNNKNTDIILKGISKGNDDIRELTLKMLETPKGIIYILILHSFGIVGLKLDLFWSFCCNKEYSVFEKTLELLKSNVFTIKEIDDNFKLKNPIPFIYNNIEIENVLFSEVNYSFDKRWNDFCNLNYDIFVFKFKKQIEKESNEK